MLEQPHKPYTAVVADFQQLQPVGSGGKCRFHCTGINQHGEKVAGGTGDKVTLTTVYRTADEEHLLFLNRIREQQPDRLCLDEYFADRHWPSSGPYQEMTLQECVAKGMELAAGTSEVFTWLTSTNRGASEVCEAALLNKGITVADTEQGFDCDPASLSTLGILANTGIVLRLTRNLDKSRGFVNGAICIVVERLRGNAYFVAKLVGSGNYVLVHPIKEGDKDLLPCCYGYATTIRRAQGASLSMGCIYFDHKYAKAGRGRGYGYVAVSRFRSRGGVYLYGHKRRTDFLPVGGNPEEEHLKRGYESETEDEDVMPEYAMVENECNRGVEFGEGYVEPPPDFDIHMLDA